MVQMTDNTSPANPNRTVAAMALSREQWRALDLMVKRVDEDRWLSSRYAPGLARHSLVALYAFNYELAKVRTTVSEPALGAIRFQWWRDTIDEIKAGTMVRKHDVAMALNELLGRGAISALIAERLIDQHEVALEENDRSKEPEGLLMGAAANQLAKTHSWGRQINELAPAYAATRRRDTKSFGPVMTKVPGLIRPALAHCALRYNYAAGIEMGPLKKRAIIMRAMVNGKV